MPKKIIIGFVGEIASGKGTAAKYLEEKYQATSHKFSTSMRDILKRLYLEINRENIQKVSTMTRENFGQDIFANVITEDIKRDTNQIMVVDGIRRFADITYLRQQPEFKLVHITAPIETRLERIRARGENADDQNKTMEQFLKDHQAEPELEILKVGATADYKIDNSGPVEELYAAIEDIIKK